MPEKIRARGPKEDDQELWDITMSEADPAGKSWLEGPLWLDQVDKRFPDGWAPCRRFSVHQGKLRPIDDFSENGTNSLFGSCERVSLKAPDEACWVTMMIFRAAAGRGDVSLTLSDGTKLTGPFHAAWADREHVRPVSKAYDLRSAYKQLPLRPAGEQRRAVLLVKDPSTGRAAGFICKTLPFGAEASVLQFNRLALLLQRILWDLHVLCGSYYDDFPTVTQAFLAGGTDNAVHATMDLLGFLLSDKEQPFGTHSETLGVVLDSSDPGFRVVKVRNKPSHAASLAEALEKILQSGEVCPRELPTLVGRLQFSESQLLGRTGRLALADIRLLSNARQHKVKLDPSQVQAFTVLRARLLAGRSREISAVPSNPPVLVFTDGACEPCGQSFHATIGCVLIVPGSPRCVRTFGGVVPTDVVDKWASGRRHVIGQTELYAVVIARILWSEILSGARCFFFIDHTGVLSASINGSSSDRSWRELLLHLEAADKADPCLSWFHRVPSESNVADPASRGRWDDLSFLHPYQVDRPTCFITGQPLEST